MTPAALRRFALSLPDAHEEPHFDRTSFRVKKRIFATMTRDGKEAMVRVPLEAVHALMESYPEVFFSYGKWTTNGGAIGVRLAAVDAALMKQLLTDSFERVGASKPRKRKR
jgi:hypothetical protein